MSLESFNSSSPGFGIGSLPGSFSTTDDGSKSTLDKDQLKSDTITPSDPGVVLYFYAAAFPNLPPPPSDSNQNSSNGTTAITSSSGAGVGLLQLSASLQQVGQNVLNSWSNSLQQQADEIRDYLKSPAYQTWQQNNTPTGQSQTDQSKSNVVDGSTAVGSTSTTPPPPPINPIIGGEPIVLSTHIQAFSAKLSANDPVAVNAVPLALSTFVIPGALSGLGASSGTTTASDATYFNNIVANLPLPQDDMRAELGLIGAIFTTGVVNYAEAQNTTDAVGGAKDHSDKNLALNYGAKVNTLVNNPNFDGFLSGMLSKSTDAQGNPVSQPQLNERIAVFKMVLLATALMAIYSSEAQHLTKEDFEGLINGTTTPRSQTEADLVASFQSIQESGVMTPDVFSTMIGGLGDYANSNPDFSSFFKVDNAFTAISARSQVETTTTASVPINTIS